MHRRSFLRQSALSVAILAAGARPAFAAAWKEGTRLPALNSFGLEGALPNVKGKVVYLDFWASWCGPCKISFPVLNQWQAALSAKGFTVLAVSVDDNAAAMRAFLTQTKATFPVVRDAAHKLVAAADVSTMPTAFLLDKAGVIRHVHSGFAKQDEPALLARINALLAQS